jgi:hypothetical protein
MPRRVNHKQTWDRNPGLQLLKQWTSELSQGACWKEAGTYVLRHAPYFSSLHAAFPDLVQQASLAAINMTENAHDRLSNRHSVSPLE